MGLKPLELFLDGFELFLQDVLLEKALHLDDACGTPEPVPVVGPKFPRIAWKGKVALEKDWGKASIQNLDQLHRERGQPRRGWFISQYNVRVGLLGVDVLGEIRLSLRDIFLNLLLSPPPFGHVSLHLPSKLHIVDDVYVNAEVQLRASALVVERMQTFEDHHLIRLDELRSVFVASIMIIDRLIYGLPLLEGLDLGAHEFEVVLASVQCRELRDLAAKAVVDVIVVEADDSHDITDGRVPRGYLSAKSAQDAP
mmetsp:Transcript_58317/g.123752  ORF Transcript_58317/g.123752 Transcript_58317/m.123752 type:complete len:254 (+) Transcript_58317:157-918(+)